MDLVLVRAYLTGLQSRITTAIAELDGGSFLSDPWEKPPGETLQGNGITQILENGKVFERAGCGFSQDRKSTRLNSSHSSVSRMPSSA